MVLHQIPRFHQSHRLARPDLWKFTDREQQEQMDDDRYPYRLAPTGAGVLIAQLREQEMEIFRAHLLHVEPRAPRRNGLLGGWLLLLGMGRSLDAGHQ